MKFIAPLGRDYSFQCVSTTTINAISATINRICPLPGGRWGSEFSRPFIRPSKNFMRRKIAMPLIYALLFLLCEAFCATTFRITANRCNRLFTVTVTSRR
jgi:hypothetical protein